MKRYKKKILSQFWIAGYHRSEKMFTRLYLENTVSIFVANKAFINGENARFNGEKCICDHCNWILNNKPIQLKIKF